MNPSGMIKVYEKKYVHEKERMKYWCSVATNKVSKFRA